MASYSVATTALALGVERKRIENILLRCCLPGTTKGRQGRAHRLSRRTVLAIALLLELQERLAVPASAGAVLLPQLLDGEQPTRTVALGPFQLSVQMSELERQVTAAIAAALEIAPRPPRGRPRRRR
jgi:hypothetical protein